MSQEPVLSEHERRILAEEEELLARVQRRLGELAGRGGDGGGEERLRELRDEATSARADDLPALLDQLHVVRAVGERRRLGPLPDAACPYFAHLRLREAGGEARDYLLGHATFLDSATGLRIIDWRHAPLSRIFYRYREQDPYEEELPGRRAEGLVEARRIVVIVDGRLRAVHAPGVVLQREAGDGGFRRRGGADLPALGGGAGSAERGLLGVGAGREGRQRGPDIAALLDKVQFDIVHAHGAKPLLVLGSAGSGKTTVALHRLAALSYGDPRTFGPKRLRVCVPEPGLARLARRLLEPLGLGNAEVSTFGAWAHAEVTRLWPELPRRRSDEAPQGVSRLKRHAALLRALPGWLEARGRGAPVEKLRQELLTDRAFLARVVEAGQSEIPRHAIEDTVQRTLRQAQPPSEAFYRHVDEDRLAALDGRGLDEGTPDEIGRTLDVEDDPLLLELHRLTRGPAARPVAHLVADEAQELGPFELSALRQALGSDPSATVAGDDVQRMDAGSGFSDWEELLALLGVPGAPRAKLEVGYRCPAPVARVAHAILGPLAPASAAVPERGGAPVGWHRFPNRGAATLFLQDALADLVAREPQASVAVLTRSSDAAARWAHDLEHVAARAVRDGDFSFDPGVDVCEVAEAKGLEFDYVIVPDADAGSYPGDDDSRRTLHVAATRAMHQLWFCSAGTPSGVLPWGS
ncbi:MAG TPA: ATP-binding domain-containing protein [Myxococcales bacterium]|nr:ATP-binding domain-containing protein [Myxococcales bacterium]